MEAREGGDFRGFACYVQLQMHSVVETFGGECDVAEVCARKCGVELLQSVLIRIGADLLIRNLQGLAGLRPDAQRLLERGVRAECVQQLSRGPVPGCRLLERDMDAGKCAVGEGRGAGYLDVENDLREIALQECVGLPETFWWEVARRSVE